MAQGDFVVAIVPDRNSATAIRKSIEGSLKNVNLDIANRAISAINTKLSKGLKPSIDIRVNETSIRSMRSSIINKIGILPIKARIDVQSINAIRSQLKQAGKDITFDIKGGSLRNFRDNLQQSVKSFDSLSSAKDKFATNVDQKFPRIISQVTKLNEELFKLKSNIPTTIDTGDLGKRTPKQRRDTQTVVSSSDQRTIDDYKRKLDDTSTALVKARQHTKSASSVTAEFGEQIGFTTRRLAAYLIPAGGIFQIFQAARFAKDSIININKETNRLTQILDEQADVAPEVTRRILEVATAYGQSSDELLKITTTLAQAGGQFTDADALVDVVTELAKTNLSATFGSLEETTNGLIAALNQFNLTAADTGRVLDITSQLSKKFAVESGDIFQAITRGGAAFAIAGGDFEEFASIVTAVRETTRLSAEQIGTAINTISLRQLRPEVVKFTNELTGGKIKNVDGTLKGITERFIEIANATKNLSDEQLGSVLDELSEIRQGKVFIPLIRDLQKASEGTSKFFNGLDVARESANALNKDAAIGLQRIDVQLQSIASRFNEVFNVLQEDQGLKELVKDFVTLTRVGADLLETITPILPFLLRLGALRLIVGAARSLPGFTRELTRQQTLKERGSVIGITGGLGGEPSRTGTPRGRPPSAPIGGDLSGVIVRNIQSQQILTKAIESNTIAETKSTVSLAGSRVPLNVLNPNFTSGIPFAGTRQSVGFGFGANISRSGQTDVIPFALSSSIKEISKEARKLHEFNLKQLPINYGGTPIIPLTRRGREIGGRNQSLPFGPSQFTSGGDIFGLSSGITQGKLILRPNEVVVQQPVQGFFRDDQGRRRRDSRGFGLRNTVPFAPFQPSQDDILRGFSSRDTLIRQNLLSGNFRPTNTFGADKSFGFFGRDLGVRAFSQSGPLTSLQTGLSEQRRTRAGLRFSDITRTESALLGTVGQQVALNAKVKKLIGTIDLTTKEMQSQGKSALEIANVNKKYFTEINEAVLEENRLNAERKRLATALAQESKVSVQSSITTAGGGRKISLPVLGATPFRRGVSSLGRGAGRLVGDLAPFGIGIGATELFSSIASSAEGGIKPLITSSGDLADSLEKIRRENESLRIKQSIASGASFGSNIGLFAGLSSGAAIGSAILPGVGTVAGGIIGALAATAAGAGVGAGVGAITGVSRAKKQSTEDLLRVPTQDPKEISLLIDQLFTDLRTTAHFFEKLPGGSFFPRFGPPTLQDTQLKLREDLSKNDSEFIKNIQNRAINIASSITDTAEIETATFFELTKEITQGLIEEQKVRGENINVNLAQKKALLTVSESFNILNGVTGRLNEKLVDAQNAGTVLRNNLINTANALRDFKDSFAIFIRDFDQGTKDLNNATNEINTQLKIDQNIFNSIFGKNSEIFRIPEETAQILSTNIQNALRTSSVTGTDRQRIDNTIRDRSGNLLSNQERNVVGDIQLIQGFLEDTVTSLSKRVSGDLFEGIGAEEAQKELTRIIKEEFNSANLSLLTKTGVSAFTDMQQQLLKLAESPDNFRGDIEGVIQGITRGLDEKILNRFTANIQKINTQFDKLNFGLQQINQINQQLTETQNEVFTTELRRAREGSVIGANFERRISDLNEVLRKISPASITEVFDRDLNSLRQSAQELADARIEQARNQDADLKNIVLDPENAFKSLAGTTIRLNDANTRYQSELLKNQQILAVFRSRLEETSNELRGLVGGTVGLGRSNRSEISESRIRVQQFEALAGGVLNKLAFAGVTDVSGLANVPPELVKEAASSFANIAGTELFQKILEGAEKFGGLQRPGAPAGITQNLQQSVELAAALAGRILAEQSGFGTSNTLTDRLLQQQLDEFNNVKTLEDNQNNAMVDSNRNSIEIVRLLTNINSNLSPEYIATELDRLTNIESNTRELLDFVKSRSDTPIGLSPTQAASDLPINRILKTTDGSDTKDFVDFISRMDKYQTELRELAKGLTTQRSDIRGPERRELSQQIESVKSLADAVDRFTVAVNRADIQGSTEVKFDGTLNLTGFNGIDKGSTSAQIVILFIDKFIQELDTSDVNQATFAQKLNSAKKILQQ